MAVVERDQRLAPLLRRFQRDGWWCDPGLHYVCGLHPSGTVSVIFRYLGLSDLIHPMPLCADAYDVIHADGEEPIRLPVGPDRVRDTLIRCYPRSRRAVAAYLDLVEAIHRTTPFLSFDLPGDVLSRTKEVIASTQQNLTAFLAGHGAEPALQHMLGRYGYYLYGVEGDECPLLAHAMVLGSFFFSAHSLPRGGDEVVDAFRRRLSENGVDLFCGRPVASLEVDHHRRLRGVRLAGEDVLECRTCVCTIHPHLLSDLLPPGAVRPSFLTRIRGLENTPAPFVVFLAVDDPPDELQRSNAYFVGRPCLERGRESILRTPLRPRGEGEVQNQLPTSFAALNCGPTGGETGRKSLCVARMGPPALLPSRQCGKPGCRETAYEQSKEREVERTLEAFFRHFPGLRSRCRVLEAATACSYESYTSTAMGSMYGLKHSVHQTDLNTRTPVKGLYLAGQSVLAPGLMGVLISGILAASHILGHRTVWDGLRKWR